MSCKYTCNKGECHYLKYIGYTEQTLEDRFRQHQSFMKLQQDVHNMEMKPKDILKSVLKFYIKVETGKNSSLWKHVSLQRGSLY